MVVDVGIVDMVVDVGIVDIVDNDDIDTGVVEF